MKSKMRPILPFLFFILTSATLGCKDDGTDPPKIPERAKLTLIDVCVKEAYLHIATTNPAINETLSLQRLPAGQAGNGATVMTFAAVADTNIADTSLTQTTAYQYTARLTANNETTGTSNTISAQTLAPTSHNFTWQTFLLGDGNNSSLSDVAIINDTLIYVVGEFYLRDSSGNETRYNLAKWNGTAWTPIRIEFFTICGQASRTAYPTSAVFAFGATDIWIAMSGSQIARWNGTTQVSTECLPISFSIAKLWGNGPNSMYAVGDGGNIMYYNGAIWQRLESGTTSIINDVWGISNPASGQVEVYCVASAFFAPEADKKILRIQNTTRVDSIGWGTGRNIFGIWSAKGFPLFTAGSGVFENSRGRWWEAPLPSIYTNAVRGNRVNDVFAVGDFGLAAHYDGVEWHVLGNDFNAGYSSIAVQSNLVVAVGNKNAKGFITMGRRQ